MLGVHVVSLLRVPGMREMSVVQREEVTAIIVEVRTGMEEKGTIMMTEETPMVDMKKVMEEAKVDMKVGEHQVCDTSY